MSYCVYKHIFPNNKVYIGITCQNPLRRWSNGFGYHQQPCIYNAIKKYGWKNVEHVILFTDMTKEEAEAKEVELIAEYKSNKKEYGYNIANGGLATGMMAEETKKQISGKLKGVPKGYSAWKGKKHSLESRKKLSEKRKGKLNPMYGKHITEETRAKMSESHKYCRLCKRILCIETGVIFHSSTEAARKMGLSQGNIGMVARGERKHTKGYHFVYLSNEGNTDGIQT